MKKQYILLFLIIIVLNFFLPRMMPGDPFLYLSMESANSGATYSQEQIDYYKAYYGFDQPLINQFIEYLKGLVTGDLGYSIYSKNSVWNMIINRIPWTTFLVLTSLTLSSVFGTLLGVISAQLRQNPIDKILYFFMILSSELPSFLIGMIFLIFFAAKLQWFPLSGNTTVFMTYQTIYEQIQDILYHGILPILTLTFTGLGNFYLLARNSVISIFSKSYIQTAKAKGLSKKRILFIHALKNALPPVIARIFMSVGTMFGGAVLVENIFAYPGLGCLMKEAVLARDYALVQGIFFIVAIIVLTMNWLSDILYCKLDPRVVIEK